MVGMLQIITYLLCTYLVFKGFEILQLAMTSARTDKAGYILGILAVVISIVAACYFVWAIDHQAAVVGQHVTS
jgi:hypothetical protein